MHCFVTGCAGFIGSHLTERLLADGHCVVGYDNFSTGREKFLACSQRSPRFRLLRGDLGRLDLLREGLRGAQRVFHLAANADVRFGTSRPDADLEHNIIGTHRVLEAMRLEGVSRIAFASSGSVYGETATIPTPENAPFPLQTSLYGASKCAAEGLIAAYCTGFGFRAHIFRFVSILGERYTHGHVFDFMQQLRAHPDRLTVLGDGRQRKSYLHVSDCIEAMMLAIDRAAPEAGAAAEVSAAAEVGAAARVAVFNLGTDEHCDVNDSIGWICEALGVSPTLEYTGGRRGWPGDNPFVYLDTRKIRSLGWRPALGIREAVDRTTAYLQTHADLLENRP